MSLKAAVSALVVCGTSGAASTGCYLYTTKYSKTQSSSDSVGTVQPEEKAVEGSGPEEGVVQNRQEQEEALPQPRKEEGPQLPAKDEPRSVPAEEPRSGTEGSDPATPPKEDADESSGLQRVPEVPQTHEEPQTEVPQPTLDNAEPQAHENAGTGDSEGRGDDVDNHTDETPESVPQDGNPKEPKDKGPEEKKADEST